MSEVHAGSPLEYLHGRLNMFHNVFYVYEDAYSAGNHFHVRGRVSSTGGENLFSMNEDWREGCHSKSSCIKISFSSRVSNWGGFNFLNGIKRASGDPEENWGDYPTSGLNLSGASELSFYAKGETGKEKVEFFAFGIGRDPDFGRPIKPYPDSSPKVSTGYLTLAPQWKEYRIDLSGLDLSYVVGGFGWVADGQNGVRDITFYIDEIKYNKQRLDEPRFILSYETSGYDTLFDRAMRNTAFVYDNAITLMAFLAHEELEGARIIADAFLYAQDHDRYFNDGRLRNAYQAGDISNPPGWEPEGSARIPGWYDPNEMKWLEDRIVVGTYAGNMAWAIISLLAVYGKTGDGKYLEAAKRLGEWIEKELRDGRGFGGYLAGYEGWEGAQTKLLYKSTEHNLDLYVAFKRLYLATADKRWRLSAEHARKFFLSMWDGEQRKFWVGTREDGVTVNQEVVPLDVQAWAILALEKEAGPYTDALSYAEVHHRVGNGYDFNTDRDGIWFEGTAHMGLAYLFAGNMAKWSEIASFLENSTSEEGAIYAANKDGLSTGLEWSYFKRYHAGATAWYALMRKGVNPFWYLTRTVFRDLAYDHWATSAILWARENGITLGYPDGTYKPEEPVKRSEMAAFIIRALEREPEPGGYNPIPYFSDVPQTHWAFKYVQRIRERNIASGYAGTDLFGPEDPITREQLAKMLIMALISQGKIEEPPNDYCSQGVPFQDVDENRWSCRFIKKLKELGLTTGYPDGTYKPETSVNRAEMAAFLQRAFME